MDDSLDAFQSPAQKIRSLSVRRKNINGESHETINKARSPKKSNQFGAFVDDTLYGVKELDFDSEGPITFEKAESNLVNSQKKIECHCPEVFNEPNFPEFGFCSICKTDIPKSQCAEHHMKCLNNKFASGHNSHVQLNNVLVCSTCGDDIKVTDFINHSEACKESNINAAKKLTNEIVTSSYFKTHDDTKQENYICPSCGKDLTILNTPQKTRHVNM